MVNIFLDDKKIPEKDGKVNFDIICKTSAECIEAIRENFNNVGILSLDNCLAGIDTGFHVITFLKAAIEGHNLRRDILSKRDVGFDSDGQNEVLSHINKKYSKLGINFLMLDTTIHILPKQINFHSDDSASRNCMKQAMEDILEKFEDGIKHIVKLEYINFYEEYVSAGPRQDLMRTWSK